MGIIATYQSITNRELDHLSLIDDGDEFLDFIEKAQEQEETQICKIIVGVEILYFLLTGKMIDEPMHNHLISESILGEYCNIAEEEIELFISYIRSDKVKMITKTLESVNFKAIFNSLIDGDLIQNRFSREIKEYKKLKIDIWEEITSSFYHLKQFYAKMAIENKSVLVIIR